VISGIGAIGSTLAATIGYLWNIGFIQLMFSFLAGSFSTYLIQHRLQIENEKRRIAREHGILMRDTIYGPLFQALNQALERIEDATDPLEVSYDKNPPKKIDEVMENHLYLLVDEELKNELCKICDGLLKYRNLLARAERGVYDLAQSKLNELYPEVKNRDPRQTYFLLSEHGMPIETVRFIKAILKRSTPLSFFRKTMTDLESPEIKVIMGQEESKDLNKIGEVFAQIEGAAWKEKRLIEFESERKKLVSALKLIIPKLKDRIVNVERARRATNASLFGF